MKWGNGWEEEDALTERFLDGVIVGVSLVMFVIVAGFALAKFKGWLG